MVVVAEIEVAADEFRLGQELTEGLEVEVFVEPVVPTTGRFAPCVWVSGPDAEAFDDHVGNSGTVDSVVALESVDGRTLYRLEWNDPSECLLATLRECNATVLEARGATRWTFTIRFPSREALSTFHEYCTERGVSPSLVRVRSGEATSADQVALTPEQRCALELATERGYFEIPRKVTLSELADELGISPQAVSERIRRGTDVALQSVMSDDHRE